MPAAGSITLGILAGPLGLILAAAYINAMWLCMEAPEFYTGDKTNQAKKEPDPQPKDTRHKTTRNFSVPLQKMGEFPMRQMLDEKKIKTVKIMSLFLLP
ncbi:hypothetical protein ACT691_20695 [Vibrio metschnikovii]